jgi:hypothetical protein
MPSQTPQRREQKLTGPKKLSLLVLVFVHLLSPRDLNLSGGCL